MQDDDGWDDATEPVEDAEPVPEPEPTGDHAVDAALAELAGLLRDQPDGERRVGGFEAAHRALQDRLADVEG